MMLSHQTLKVVADTVNPLLAIFAVALPFVKWRGRWFPSLIHIAVTSLTLASMYLLRAVLALEAVWASWGLDFSTHTAVCIILGFALASLHWRTAWVWGVVVLGYAMLMVYQGYHTWLDLLTTGLVMFPFTALIRYCSNRWGVRARRSPVDAA